MTGELLTFPNGTQRKSIEPWVYDWIEYYPHQIDGIRRLANKKSFILGDDMGLGKTLTCLSLFGLEVVRSGIDKLLIICPATLKENWAAEFEKFTSIPFAILEGNPDQRNKILVDFKNQAGPRALVTNYELVHKHGVDLNRIQFDIKILDEAHYAKNPNAQRTKGCHSVITPRTFLVTGTPIENHVNDLWSLFHMIDPKRWPRYYGFLSRYAVFGGFKDKQIISVKNEAELKGFLDEYMLRRLAKDVLDLKDPIPITRFVKLLPPQQEMYNEVLEGMLTNMITGEELEIDNALVKLLRLKQIASTTAAFMEEDHSAILDLAIEDIEEITSRGYKVVVFTQFVHMLQATRKRLEKVGIPSWEVSGRIPQKDRVGIIRDWSNSKATGVLVCMLQVTREGLNMTAASYGLLLDKLFTPSKMSQAIGRLNRIGQDITKAVTIIDYRCKDTIHDRVEQILANKVKITDSVIEGKSEDPTSWKREIAEAMRDALSLAGM